MDEKITNQKLKTHIYFWYGNADFVIWETVKAWREAFAKKYGLENFISLSSDELKNENGARRLNEALANQSLFSVKRFVVLKIAEKLDKQIIEALAGIIPALSSDTTLVLWSQEAPDQRTAWVKDLRALVQKGAAQIKAFYLSGSKEIRGLRDECTVIDPIKFAEQRLKKAGLIVARPVCNYLVERVGDDLWRLNWDIQKCASYVGSGGKVTNDIIKLLTSVNTEEDIFALVDAISEGRLAAALARLEEHLLQDSDPHYLLSMIARQVRLLIDLDVFHGDLPGAHPFVIKKITAQARRYNRDSLERLLKLVLDLETKLKTTSLPPSALLTKFLLETAERTNKKSSPHSWG